MPLLPGTRLGPYEILAPIGAGGMGEVYRARDTRLKRDVAIKVLPASYSQDADRLRRFDHEAQAAGALNHPNITAVYDIGTHDGAPYVVQELLEGETLRSALAGGKPSVRKGIDYALQIAHGLAAAHDKGIVHRDLKPENVFVVKDGRVKILDFGLAKLTEAPGSSSQTNMPTATPGTEPGVVLGTLGYMSPEQVRGKPADARSDIFSFGAIFYEMLSGQRAFRGDSAADTMSAILMKEPPELSQTTRAVSPGLERVIRHCLEKDLERRFHSAHDLAFDLEALSDVSGLAPRAATARKAWRRIVFAGLLALAVGGAAFLRLRPRQVSIESLAVLPFVNASGDANLDYLSDGITESLINNLSQLPKLTVMSRNSVFHFKGSELDAQAAGKKLGVQTVLTGRVVQRGNNLGISVELVDVGNNSQVWGERYDRKLADILSTQQEITRDISSKLQRRLSGEAEQRLAKGSTENTEAYQLYLKGRYFWNQRGKGLQKSIGLYEQALQKDSRYALAYTGLADSYNQLAFYGYLSALEAMPKAKVAIQKALEIDDTLVEAHSSLAFIHGWYDRDPEAAEREFERALALDPAYPPALYWRAGLLAYKGLEDEAIAEDRQAVEADPLSHFTNTHLGWTLILFRRTGPAIEQLRKAVDLNPSFVVVHWLLGRAYQLESRSSEAIAEFQKAVDLSENTPWMKASLGWAYATSGNRAEGLRILAELEVSGTREYVRSYAFAMVYAGLGDKERALESLERAYRDRDLLLPNMYQDPAFDHLRSEPRFVDLVRRVGVAPTDWQTRLK